MTNGQHCSCCVNQLAFGLRLKRILLYMVRHACEWEQDPNLAGLTFRFIPGNDQTRVTYRLEIRERFEEVA